uniref:Uncharacterized protein n=2 Tax=Salmonella sp. TaxID=599 RepID=A0A482EX96_SALSP|nr:hypothetical protein NNIBIDOC_00146 [Salmonella sp.]
MVLVSTGIISPAEFNVPTSNTIAADPNIEYSNAKTAITGIIISATLFSLIREAPLKRQMQKVNKRLCARFNTPEEGIRRWQNQCRYYNGTSAAAGYQKLRKICIQYYFQMGTPKGE